MIVKSFALLFSIAAVVIGYVALGLIPAIVFTFGFLGGYILWLLIPSNASYLSIRVPFFLTLALFVVHKIEERTMDFFPALSEITGVPVPDMSSPLVYLLYATAIAWLLIPFLLKRGYSLGYYFAWTFFASMGITELAHFIFPFFLDAPYGYFPGMVSVIVLAPAAWWGMYVLTHNRIKA